MTKLFTTEEIIKALQYYPSMEFMSGNNGEGIYYFIHLDLDTLELVSNEGWNIESFNVEYFGWVDKYNDPYGWENMENEDFINVAEGLKNQVNDFIKDL